MRYSNKYLILVFTFFILVCVLFLIQKGTLIILWNKLGVNKQAVSVCLKDQSVIKGNICSFLGEEMKRKEKISKKQKHLLFYSDNKLVKEKIEKEDWIHFLYENRFGKLLCSILSRRWFSKLIGLLKTSSLSKRGIKKFIKKYDINMTEVEKGVASFKNFNEFFIRKLKAGSRIIDTDPNVVVSPCDGKAFIITNIQKEDEFFVKDKKFYLEKFLQNPDLASLYEGGTLMLFRLAPYDYHRFHFPFNCVPYEPKILNGRYYSVHPFVYQAGFQPLLENERHLIRLKTKEFSDVAMVLIGAMCVGKIVETYKADSECNKGDEVGYFAFGGSSMVLLFKPETVIVDEKLLQHSLEGFETEVKFGQSVGFVKS